MATWKEKRELRAWYKRYKIGMTAWEDIPEEIQHLLVKYYGVR